MKTGRRRSRKKQELLQTLTFFSVIFALIFGLIGYLWVYVEVDETLLNIEIQKKTVRVIDDEIKELRNKIEVLSRVDVISRKARSELDMVPARPETLIVYLDHKKGRVLRGD